MFTVDVKTVMFSYFMTNALCTGVTFWIWLQYRRHFPGTGHWLGNCIFQTLGMLLIILRGIIPDWASMVVGNASIVFLVTFCCSAALSSSTAGPAAIFPTLFSC